MGAWSLVLLSVIIAAIAGFLLAVKLGFFRLRQYRLHFIVSLVFSSILYTLAWVLPLTFPYLHLQIEIIREIPFGYYVVGAEVLFGLFQVFIKPLFSDLTYIKAFKLAIASYLSKKDIGFFSNQEFVRKYYDTHVRWRFEVLFRRLLRWIEDSKLSDIPNMRAIAIFILGISVIGAIYLFLSDKKTWLDWILNPENINKGSSTLILAAVSVPFAFLIWWFRDVNVRQQIENQRKDVNLKDFQRLAEWVSGLHLPEDKIIDVTKQQFENGTKKTEQSFSREFSQIPLVCSTVTPSRRDGSASLQIAAIYQLGAFLNGEYGKYFQRPAFQLLKSVWFSLVSKHDDEWRTLMKSAKNNYPNLLLVSDAESPTIDYLDNTSINFSLIDEELQKFQFECQSWAESLNKLTSTPIARALINTMGSHYGKNLRTQLDDLPDAMLLGYRSVMTSIYAPLELDSLKGIDLRGVNFRGADLQRALFNNADLSWAQLQCADLWEAKFQGAEFYLTNCIGANLGDARFDGAHVENSFFNGVSLRGASFQDCEFMNCNMTRVSSFHANFSQSNFGSMVFFKAQLGHATFERASLKLVKFDGARLTDAKFIKAKIGEGTSLKQADCSRANFSEAIIFHADFSGATLEQVNLENTCLINITFDSNTKFDSSKTNEHTIVLKVRSLAWEDLSYFEKLPSIDEVDVDATLDLRANLKKVGLILPDRLYKEIF